MLFFSHPQDHGLLVYLLRSMRHLRTVQLVLRHTALPQNVVCARFFKVLSLIYFWCNILNMQFSKRKGASSVPDFILDNAFVIILVMFLFAIYIYLAIPARGAPGVVDRIVAIKACMRLDLSGCWDLI